MGGSEAEDRAEAAAVQVAAGLSRLQESELGGGSMGNGERG